MENNRRCDLCKIDVQRASYAKTLRSRKRLEIKRQGDIILPELLFKEEQTPIKKKFQNVYNPKTVKQKLQIILNYMKEILKKLAKKMINP